MTCVELRSFAATDFMANFLWPNCPKIWTPYFVCMSVYVGLGKIPHFSKKMHMSLYKQTRLAAASACVDCTFFL